MIIREASDVYKSPRATLARRVQSDSEAVRHPTVLSEEEEILLCEHLTLVAEWGYPLTRTNLRYMVKDYLDKK
uniref:Uncharacterized protein n=1 Tax=Romanomermis culicivorax TaxID=13658 RepID=A0A915JSG0_ROMCU